MNFKINKTSDCGMKVVDTTTYLTTSALTKLGDIYYTKDECTVVDFLTKLYTDDSSTPYGYSFSGEFTFGEDGIYQVTHVIVPNMTWFNKYKSEVLSLYGTVYILDDSKLYQYDGTNLNEVEMSVLLKASGNVLSLSKYTFSACVLSLLYLTEAKNTLLGTSTTTFKRDMLKVFIDCIRYCIVHNKYFEAQRWIDKLNSCKALGLDTLVKKRNSGCGCGR